MSGARPDVVAKLVAMGPFTFPEGIDDDSPPPGPWRVAAGPTIRIAPPPERKCKPERTRRLAKALTAEHVRQAERERDRNLEALRQAGERDQEELLAFLADARPGVFYPSRR